MWRRYVACALLTLAWAANAYADLPVARPSASHTYRKLSDITNSNKFPDTWMEKYGFATAWRANLDGSGEVIVSWTPGLGVPTIVCDSDIANWDIRAFLLTNSDEVGGNALDDDGDGCADNIHGCYTGAPTGYVCVPYPDVGNRCNSTRYGGDGTGIAGCDHDMQTAMIAAGRVDGALGTFVNGLAPAAQLYIHRSFPSLWSSLSANDHTRIMNPPLSSGFASYVFDLHCAWDATTQETACDTITSTNTFTLPGDILFFASLSDNYPSTASWQVSTTGIKADDTTPVWNAAGYGAWQPYLDLSGPGAASGTNLDGAVSYTLPKFAAIAAIMRERYAGITSGQIRTALVETAYHIGDLSTYGDRPDIDPRRSGTYGYGMVDIWAALNYYPNWEHPGANR